MCRGASCRALSENRCKSRDPTKQRDRMIKCRRAATEVNAANKNKTVLIARDGAERMNWLCPRGRRKMFSVCVLARALEIKAVLYGGTALIVRCRRPQVLRNFGSEQAVADLLSRLPRQPVHLALDQFAVKPLAAHELVGGAVLDGAAGLQDDDAVEVAHGGEPVGDGDHGAAAHQAGERLADDFLGFTVERRGGFVEQEERRVLEEGAGDGDALALAAGELDAAVADDGAHALRQLLDE